MKQKSPTDSYSEIFGNASRVLVFMAHPDDAEIICGGTIARLRANDVDVRLVVATDGEKGTKNAVVNLEQFRKARREEAQKGAKALGISPSEVFLLGYNDGEMPNDLHAIEQFSFHIRQFRPDIVIGHNPFDLLINFSETSRWINHRDHRHCGIVTADALYPLSRDRGFFPEQFKDPSLSFHEVHSFLYSDAFTHANKKLFDITDYIESKRKAIMQHSSAIPEDEVADLIEENALEGRYFEPLGFLKIY